MSVQEAYREYRDGNFRVNRRYQRKLVWTLNEKRKLIDSLLHGYPIPLFLFAVSGRPNGKRAYEIVDGMQRLNAIFDFIENSYDLNGRYFDVDQLSRAKQLAAQNVFDVKATAGNILHAKECADLLDYQLAVTEFPGANEESVNDIFGRINAFGRHLSDQERRQAGVGTMFATTVRELAAQLRGDESMEVLDLASMPKISIDVDGDHESYGIAANDTFWCKQGILRKSQLRESEDEQLIADLLVSILDEQAFAFSGKNLDIIYDPESSESKRLNDLLASYGTERVKSEVAATISIIKSCIESIDPEPNALRRVVHPTSNTNPIKTAFYAVFMAFFDLCVRRKKAPANSKAILRSLHDLQSKLHVSAGAVRSEPRQQNVDLTRGLIQKHFEPAQPPIISRGAGTIIRFENAIRRSKVETSTFECKQGLLALDDKRKPAPGLLEKIVETVCAIANTAVIGPDGFTGALFVGVADKDADVRRIENLDGVQAHRVGSRYCVGVDRELVHLGIDMEAYKRRIVSHISSSNLSQPLKTAVLSNVDCITYKGLSVICIWIPTQRAVSAVDDVVYVREDSNNKKVEGLTQTQAVMSLFR
ncbi:GmrSD restriction endonuclease domain-containing protein [Polyangium sorediatum]|nr:DUF262 domain-containing protein [Polyangium sorediatum]